MGEETTPENAQQVTVVKNTTQHTFKFIGRSTQVPISAAQLARKGQSANWVSGVVSWLTSEPYSL